MTSNMFLIRIAVATLVLMSLFLLNSGVSAEPQGQVSRAQFTTHINDKEPVNQVLVLTNNITKIIFFSEIADMAGKTVSHHWEYNGKPVSQKEFNVGGPRWRIYSEKDLDRAMTGVWSVVVRDSNDWPLKVVMFKYVDSDDESQSTMILQTGN